MQKSRRNIMLFGMLMVLSCAIFVTFIIHYLVIGSWGMDNNLYMFFQQYRTPQLDQTAVLVTSAGNPAMVILWTAAVVLVLFFKKKVPQALYFVFVVVTSWLMNDLIKVLIQRPRPLYHWLVDANNYSFPSGHSMTFMTFTLFFIYLLTRYARNKILVRMASILLFVFAIMVGLSRVYVGVHYLSDVVAGWSFAAFWFSANMLVLNSVRHHTGIFKEV